MDPTSNDVKTGAEASPTPESTAPESKTEAPSSQAHEPSLQDSVAAMLKEKHGIDLTGKENQEEGAGKSTEKADPQHQESGEEKVEKGKEKTPDPQKQEEKDKTKTGTEKVEQQPPEKKDFTDEELAKLPVRAQTRIRELVKERNEMEGKFKQQYEEPASRMTNVENFCRSANITGQDFNNLLQLFAEVRKNPVEGIKKAEEHLIVLKQQAGLILQPDLQKKVDDGALDLETAKEINRLRLVEQGRKVDGEMRVRENQQNAQAQLVNATKTWEEQKFSTDPDFFKKQPGQPDGLYELTHRLFHACFWDGQHPCKTIADAMALLDQCYNDTKASILSFQPRPARKKQPVDSSRTNGSSPKEEPQKVDISKPGWARGAVNAVLEKHGISR